jgi:peptide/nickel transport system substrate-binding protein
LEDVMDNWNRTAADTLPCVRLNRRQFMRYALAGTGMVLAPITFADSAHAESAATLSGTSSSDARLQTATPTAGGDLVAGVATKYIDVLDPNITAQTVAHEVMMPIFDTLVYQDRDGKFWPGLATSWDIAPDGKSYIFKLHDGVTFHDGTPFDAAAVKFNFDRMVAPDSKSRLAGPRLTGFYDSAVVVDPLTVRIVLQQPNGAFLTDLSQDFMAMLSPSAVEQYGTDEIGRHPTGTGPFKFVEWVENSHVKVERNDAYNWASPMFKHQGPAYLQTITFRIIPEDGSRMAALEASELNYVDEVPTIDFARIKDDPAYKTYSVQQPGIPWAYMINTKRPPTDELAVRQAINFAVDKQAIINTLYQGLYTPAYGPLSPATFAYDPEVEKIYNYDPTKAEQLLEEAGWKVGSDGIRVKNDKRLEINHYVFIDTKVAEVMQAQLKQVGIQSNVTLLEVGAVNEAATRGEVTNMAPLPFRDADPAVLCVALCIKNEGKGFAWTFHHNEELDKELELGQATTDPEERKAHYAKAQMIAMQEALLIPVYNAAGLSASTAQVQDVAFDVKGVDPWTYDIWIMQQ